MFSSARAAFFISKNFIEPGVVSFSRGISFFQGSEAVSYAGSDLKAMLPSLESVRGKKARIVLAEELVYVTALFFPSETKITRDVVQAKAEETIPEALRTVQWDFRTMQYVEGEQDKEGIPVQVAVVEQSFAPFLQEALQLSSFETAVVLPESYALASLADTEEGLVVIAAENRENALLVACERGLVLVTKVQKESFRSEAIIAFIAFVEERFAKKVSRVFLSRINDQELHASLESLGYEGEVKEYNPLLAPAFEQIRGDDEQVLNLHVKDVSKGYFFGFLRKKAS